MKPTSQPAFDGATLGETQGDGWARVEYLLKDVSPFEGAVGFYAILAVVLIGGRFAFVKLSRLWKNLSRLWKNFRKKPVSLIVPGCRYTLPDGTVVRIRDEVKNYADSKYDVIYYIEDEWVRWQQDLEVDPQASDPKVYRTDVVRFHDAARLYTEGPVLPPGEAAGAVSLFAPKKDFRLRKKRKEA